MFSSNHLSDYKGRIIFFILACSAIHHLLNAMLYGGRLEFTDSVVRTQMFASFIDKHLAEDESRAIEDSARCKCAGCTAFLNDALYIAF